jgi:hypothetical protein
MKNLIETYGEPLGRSQHRNRLKSLITQAASLTLGSFALNFRLTFNSLISFLSFLIILKIKKKSVIRRLFFIPCFVLRDVMQSLSGVYPWELNRALNTAKTIFRIFIYSVYFLPMRLLDAPNSYFSRPILS